MRPLVVGSELGGYAAAPAIGGGRRAVREAAEEASEQLARQGAREAAQESDEWVRLYRVVSMKELEDIMKTSERLRPHPSGFSLAGKWFTTTPELAAQWGKKLWKYDKLPYSIIEIGVPKRILKQMYYSSRLDFIGPAYYAEGHLLPSLRFIRELPYIPWIP